MVLNKKFVGYALTIASTLMLAACGGGDTDTDTTGTDTAVTDTAATGDLQDGTYTLVEKNLDDNGWRTEFSITVVDGVITESNYDNVNEAGESKVDDDDYQAMMSDKTGVGPQDFIPALNEQLVDTQDPAEVEVVTGATHSSESFVQYAEQLLDAAKEGNTETIEIDN